MPYRPISVSVEHDLEVRGLRYRLREWQVGATPAPLLVLLHGYMDVSASFQFLVDCLRRRWRVVSFDWRGFGASESGRADSYWFPDYLGDLDAVLDALSPAEPVRLVGHSMGGNIAMIYAGVRPRRVAGLVNLEGFGLKTAGPALAPARYAEWLDSLRRPMRLRDYPSRDAVAERLMTTNPRLPLDKARFLAAHWAAPDPKGRQVVRADPAHRRVNPVLYRLDEVLACWRAIEAPVLWVSSDADDASHRFTRTAEYRQRLTAIARLTEKEVADAGHMLHHDQPAAVARLVEEFFTDE
ncbi:MAG: alpha/beta fold hydrolase [Lautropia sp.]